MCEGSATTFFGHYFATNKRDTRAILTDRQTYSTKAGPGIELGQIYHGGDDLKEGGGDEF